MGKLIYSITTSMDGFVADDKGNFDWAEPSEEVHAFVNDIVKNVGTSLLGRKMYDVMKVWETIPADGPSEAMNSYAKIWRSTQKIVYSSTLSEVSTAKTIIERKFNPEEVKEKVAGSDKDFDIGGPHLAAEAIASGIVDEYHQFIAPVIIGSGNHWLPKGVSSKLKLVDVHKFDNGFVYLFYKKV